MATKNRRVAAYLPPEIDKAFIEFKIENGFATSEDLNQNDSQALIKILTQFFGVDYSVAHSSESDILRRISDLEQDFSRRLSNLEATLENRVAHLIDSIDENRRFTEGVKSEFLSGSKSSDSPGQLNLLMTSHHEVEHIEQHTLVPVDQVPAHLLRGLSQRTLSIRLNVDHTTVARNRKKGFEEFSQWSGGVDPDGISWEFRDSKYYPITSN
jgi:hypothetical protein